MAGDFFVYMTITCIFVYMEVKHMHIKIPKRQYEELMEIKKIVGIDMQTIISIAIKDYLIKTKDVNNNDK